MAKDNVKELLVKELLHDLVWDIWGDDRKAEDLDIRRQAQLATVQRIHALLDLEFPDPPPANKEKPPPVTLGPQTTKVKAKAKM